MISALTLVILVAMGVGGYIAHPKAVASSEASIRPVYPGTASPTPKPTATAPVEPTATPTPTPTKTATPSKPSFKTPPPSFGTFSLTNQLSVRQGQLWRALYTDDSGGQVWVATEVGTRLQEKVDAMRDVAVYEGGFACGVVQNRLCVGRLTNGVVTVAAFDSSNDALASVMATLLDAVK